jgi:hypothetical protein
MIAAAPVVIEATANDDAGEGSDDEVGDTSPSSDDS